MSSAAILYPSFVMFALTASCIGRMGFTRYRAIQRGDVSIKYYRIYKEGAETEKMHLLTRHVQNHFEVPPLLHIGVILAYVTGTGGYPALVFAWLYVAARYLHSYIHLGSNNVSRRFFTFGTSLVFLTGLWLSVLVGLLQSAA